MGMNRRQKVFAAIGVVTFLFLSSWTVMNMITDPTIIRERNQLPRYTFEALLCIIGSSVMLAFVANQVRDGVVRRRAK
jgi:hypothetical protein